MTPAPNPANRETLPTVDLRQYVEALFFEKQRALDVALAVQKEAVTRAEIATDRLAARALSDQQTLRKEISERLLALRRELEAATAGQKRELSMATDAQKEALVAALLASDKAISKAEEAQLRVNVGQNEFRSANLDVLQQMMPRKEFENQHGEIVRQLDELRASASTIFSDLRVEKVDVRVWQDYVKTSDERYTTAMRFITQRLDDMIATRDDKFGSIEKQISQLRSRIDVGPAGLATLQSSADKASGANIATKAYTATLIAIMGILLTTIMVVSIILTKH